MDGFPATGSPMLPKLIIIAFLLAIVASLASGMFFLIRDPSNHKRTVNALTVRISLSLLLIVFLVLAYFMGWIQPHGIVD